MRRTHDDAMRGLMAGASLEQLPSRCESDAGGISPADSDKRFQGRQVRGAPHLQRPFSLRLRPASWALRGGRAGGTLAARRASRHGGGGSLLSSKAARVE